MKSNMEMCISCEDYFWKNQHSMLPAGLFIPNKCYCPQCYPNALEEYTSIYWGNDYITDTPSKVRENI